MPATRMATAVLAALLLPVTMTAPSEANFRRLRSNYTPGEVVIAQSHFGNGTATGIVRPGRYGWQVQLPRGAWVGCRRSCEETLRVETVDLTENDNSLTGYGTLSRECGVFGCLRFEFSY